MTSRAVHGFSLASALAVMASLASSLAVAQPPNPAQALSFHIDNVTEQPGKYKRTWKPAPSAGSGVEAELTNPVGYATDFKVYMDPWHYTGLTNFNQWREFHVKIDMNNDGQWEIDTRQSGYGGLPPIFATWNYPNPPYLTSAPHTIRFEVRGFNLAADETEYVSGTAPIRIVPDRDVTYRTSSRYASALSGYLSPDGVLDRPLVIVEGYDSLNENYAPDVFDLTFPVLRGMSASAGYDVFVYNFADATQPMQDNAMGLLGSLVRLYADTAPVKTKIIGLSMGGVIARYALAWAENSRRPGVGDPDTYHSCDTFISFDSPQQGAWVNVQLQQLIRDHDGDPAIGDLVKAINSPAAKQLIRNNIYDTTAPPSHVGCIAGGPTHEAFYDYLNTLNVDGYPDNTYNVALSNAQGNIAAKWIYSAQQESYENTNMLTLSLKGVTLGVVNYTEFDLRAGSLQPAYLKNPTPLSISLGKYVPRSISVTCNSEAQTTTPI